MKKIVTYIVIFISLTAFYVKADSCDGYELRLRDNLQKEEVLKCLTTYKEAKEETIKMIADHYKNLIPEKLYNAMYEYEVNIND